MKTNLLGTLAVIAGLFLCVGVVSASDADVLQPAGATTSLESLRVGVAGQGGVTFFNGSVLNEGGAFTVADDMRIDGRVYRGEAPGPGSAPGDGTPFIVNDDLEILGDTKAYGNIVPSSSYSKNLGSSSNHWRYLYSQNARFTGDVYLGGTTLHGNLNIDGNINPTTNRAYNLGSESTKYEKLWTDQADVRQLSTAQFWIYNQVTGQTSGYIADAGDDYSIKIRGGEGDMELEAQDGSNIAAVKISDNSVFKLPHHNTASPYTCNASHEGEMYYDTSGAVSHQLRVCEWSMSGGYGWASK